MYGDSLRRDSAWPSLACVNALVVTRVTDYGNADGDESARFRRVARAIQLHLVGRRDDLVTTA